MKILQSYPGTMSINAILIIRCSTIKKGASLLFYQIIFSVIICALSLSAYIPAFGPILSELEMTPDIAATSMSVYLLCFAFVQLLLPSGVKRLGRKKSLLFSLTLLIIASLLCAFTTSSTIFLLGRCLQGAACGILYSLSFNLVHNSTQNTQRRTQNAYLAAIFAASLLFSPLIGDFITYLFSWRAIFLIIALSSCLLMIGYLKTPIELPEELVESPTANESLFFSRGFISYAFCAALSFSTLLLVLVAYSLIFLLPINIPAHSFALFASLCTFSFFLGAFFNGSIKNKLSINANIYLGLLILIISASLNVFWASMDHFSLLKMVILMPFVCFGAGIIYPASVYAAIQTLPHPCLHTSSILSFIMMFTASLMVFFSGVLATHYHLPLLVLLLVVGLLALFNFWLFVPKENRLKTTD